MLIASIVINFFLLVYIFSLQEKVSIREKTILLLTNNNIPSSKTAWYQFHYIITSYTSLLAYNKELEKAFIHLHNEPIVSDKLSTGYIAIKKVVDLYRSKGIFSRDWEKYRFPKFGEDEIARLSKEFEADYNKQLINTNG